MLPRCWVEPSLGFAVPRSSEGKAPLGPGLDLLSLVSAFVPYDHFIQVLEGYQAPGYPAPKNHTIVVRGITMHLKDVALESLWLFRSHICYFLGFDVRFFTISPFSKIGIITSALWRRFWKTHPQIHR